MLTRRTKNRRRAEGRLSHRLGRGGARQGDYGPALPDVPFPRRPYPRSDPGGLLVEGRMVEGRRAARATSKIGRASCRERV